MAKQTITPGGSIDAVTGDELARLFDAFLRSQAPARPIRAMQEGKTDANGNVSIDAYEVPPGMEFELSRVVIQADGFTPGVPFAAAGASWGEVRRSGTLIDWFTDQANTVKLGLPNRLSWNQGANSRIRNGEVVQVVILNNPGGALANVGVLVTIYGRLYVLPED